MQWTLPVYLLPSFTDVSEHQFSKFLREPFILEVIDVPENHRQS